MQEKATSGPGSASQAEQDHHQHLGADKTLEIRQSVTIPTAVARSVNCPEFISCNHQLTPKSPQGTMTGRNAGAEHQPCQGDIKD